MIQYDQNCPHTCDFVGSVLPASFFKNMAGKGTAQ